MSGNATKEKLRLGFLTAIEVPEKGYVGGLLVTNHLGRPLEFQCTAPVLPNRTQQILYGPTLVPFIQSELIGKTLVDKVGVKPDIVLIDSEQLLELREHIALPVACLDDLEEVHAATEQTVSIGQHQLRIHESHAADEKLLTGKSHLIPDGANLREPFERVREALQETTNTGAKR